MKDQKVVWRTERFNRKVVILPGGSEIDAKLLAKKRTLSYATSVVRINEYIVDGNYKDLMRKNRVKKKAKRPKVEKAILSETHYEAGDLRMYVDPFWKVLAKI
jgi:hypothetical protein